MGLAGGRLSKLVGGWPPKEGGSEVDTPTTLPEGNMAGVSHRGVTQGCLLLNNVYN